MRKTLLSFFAMFAIALVFLGCTNKTKETIKNTSYTVTDSEGTIVKFEHKPTRIVTQSLTLDTLLLGVVDPSRLAACNVMAHEPEASFITEETKNIPNILHTFSNIPVDLVLDEKVDLVIVSTTAQRNMINTLRDLGIPVLVIETPKSIEKVREDIRIIAQATDEKEAGEKVIKEFNVQLEEIHEKIGKLNKPKPIGMLISMMTSYGGKGSMFDVICSEAHVINGIAEVGLSHGEKITKELIVKADPDFFMISAPKKINKGDLEEFRREFINDEAYKGMKALKNIKMIPNRYLYTNSQNCVYAIKGIVNYAYGPIFDIKEERLIKGY